MIESINHERLLVAGSWDVPMSTTKLQTILQPRMGFHLLPFEQGCHVRLPCHRRQGVRLSQGHCLPHAGCSWSKVGLYGYHEVGQCL